MQIPTQVTLLDVPRAQSVEALIRRRAAGLERFHGRITSCRVAVRAPHRSSAGKDRYHVRVEITLPGADLVVGNDPGDPVTHEDVQVAIRDAFRVARRRLVEHARKARHEVKTPVGPPHGRVLRLIPAGPDSYGFLAAPDGTEVYFHRNAVVGGDFDALRVGDEVRFSTERGEKGVQATTVTPASRHRFPEGVRLRERRR